MIRKCCIGSLANVDKLIKSDICTIHSLSKASVFFEPLGWAQTGNGFIMAA